MYPVDENLPQRRGHFSEELENPYGNLVREVIKWTVLQGRLYRQAQSVFSHYVSFLGSMQSGMVENFCIVGTTLVKPTLSQFSQSVSQSECLQVSRRGLVVRLLLRW